MIVFTSVHGVGGLVEFPIGLFNARWKYGHTDLQEKKPPRVAKFGMYWRNGSTIIIILLMCCGRVSLWI
jgi:hypothetical protein